MRFSYYFIEFLAYLNPTVLTFNSNSTHYTVIMFVVIRFYCTSYSSMISQSLTILATYATAILLCYATHKQQAIRLRLQIIKLFRRISQSSKTSLVFGACPVAKPLRFVKHRLLYILIAIRHVFDYKAVETTSSFCCVLDKDTLCRS